MCGEGALDPREAMAAGLCVLAARCPEADEALGADGGMTLPPFSAEAWADAIAGCLGNPARVAMFGAEAERRVATPAREAAPTMARRRARRAGAGEDTGLR